MQLPSTPTPRSHERFTPHMRVVVIGARGQLGAAVVHEFRPHHDVTALVRADLDICDAAAVESTVAAATPDVVINCAAYNAVDAAEDHPIDALRANAMAVRNLARAAAQSGAALIHCSTDFVFDGTAARPYVEDDRPNPRSVYAASKLLGEWFASDAPRSYVLRVESLFGRAPDGPPAKGSVETIVAALRDGRAPRVFQDRTVSPTYVPHAASAMRWLLEHQAPTGLYHCVSSGHCTWLEFALEAARLLGVAPRVEAVRVADVVLRAERPQYCALSNGKLVAAGVELPSWRSALEEYLSSFRDDLRHQLAHG
jgi:dTDP-4-dehydrorhamnose reductase